MDWHSHFDHPIADGKLTYCAIQLSSAALVDKLLAVCLNTWKQWRTRKMCQVLWEQYILEISSKLCIQFAFEIILRIFDKGIVV